MSGTQFVGRSIPRIESVDKVAGRAIYTDDLELPGMLYGRLLRSPIPHGKLLQVDASRALRVPGVIAVLTRDDLVGDPGLTPYYGPAFRDQPVVAIDRVRYVGDPVAAVAAVEEETAEEALELIEVEYEELPAVFDPLEAVAPGAPLLHETLVLGKQFTDLTELHPDPQRNIANHFRLRHGDVAQGFRNADEVFEDTFRTPYTQHAALEPHTTLAAVDSAGRITVWSGTQTPFVIRGQLAEMFHLPESMVRVIVPYLGGSFGAKTYPKLEPVAVCLARKARRPVKVVLSREEVFLTITRHESVVRLKTGVKRDGTLVARECEVYWGTGAYADIGPRLCKKSGTVAAGPYRLPHVSIDSYCVFTNKPPAGALRGYGIPQLCWAYESQMDEIAQRLGMDPVELRLKNLVREGDRYHTGERLHSVPVQEALKAVVKAMGWSPDGTRQGRPSGRFRGRGVACTIKNVLTPSTSQALITLNSDGSAMLFSSTVDMGQGSDTILAQLAAQELGLPLERVRIVRPDTDVTPYDTTTSSSRSTFHMGRAVQAAAQQVREQLLELAAQRFEISPADLEVREGTVAVKGTPEKAVSFGELIRARFGGAKAGTLIGQGEYTAAFVRQDEDGQSPHSAAFFSLGAGAAEVEVDPETGRVTVLKYVAGGDMGRPISPAFCQQQVLGAAVMGLGNTFSEEMLFESGQPVNASFLHYKLPSTEDLPQAIEVALVEDPHREGPHGAKGIGETGIEAPSPAIANAICQALGVRIKELPLTPQKVLQALDEQCGPAPAGPSAPSDRHSRA